MKFSELVRGASLRGSPAVFTPTTTLRLGRAVGTLLRRRMGEQAGPVVVARAGDGAELIARDGLCQGLVLSGFDVIDLGVAESDLFTFALRTVIAGRVPGAGPPLPGRSGPGTGALAVGGALVGTTGDSVGIMLFSGSRPLVGDGLVEVARIADDGAFCAGPGTLVTHDLRVAFRQSPPPGGSGEGDAEVEA